VKIDSREKGNESSNKIASQWFLIEEEKLLNQKGEGNHLKKYLKFPRLLG